MIGTRIRTGALAALSLAIILASASSEQPPAAENPLLPFSTILGGSSSDSASEPIASRGCFGNATHATLTMYCSNFPSGVARVTISSVFFLKPAR